MRVTTTGDRTNTAENSLNAVANVLTGAGINGRPIRLALAMLIEGPHTLDELVRACALPRRTVESLLRAADSDLTKAAGRYAISRDRLADYRARFGYAQLRESALGDPLAGRLASQRGLIAQLDADIRSAPAAKEALDHVGATAETVVRRALWLDASFELAGARLLCIGDHDLTSLAMGAIRSTLAVTVVDVDERLLEFIELRAARRGYDVQCRYADLRFGIPEAVAGSADLVLTDPPYTPGGVQLFVGRGLQGLADRINGRVVMAYGFSPLHPALGVKVQRAVQDLDLAVEAILPAFNRYHGAQAIGSASDMYVCRPTARTWQVLDKRLGQASVNIYTHGAQSLEGQGGELDEAVARAVIGFASGSADGEHVLLAGDGWPGPAVRGQRLETLFGSGLPASATRRRPVHVAANLADDPGSWLLRALLAVNADRLALLVPNNHPDLTNEAAQRALIELVAPKYALRLRRTTPNSRYAIVDATSLPGDSPRRWLLEHAHGKIGNVWREALIRIRAEHAEAPLTKNGARTLVSEAISRPGWLESRLIDLPRHAIRELLTDVDTSVDSIA
jgi:hypothetical protein